MGIFDKLFGKKNTVPEPDNTPEPENNPEHQSSSPYFPVLADLGIEPVKYESPFLRDFSYEEIEQMISANPLSAKYRRETQQQSSNISTIEWEDFKQKSKGSFVSFDIETTGLDHESDYIVEVAAVRIKNGQIVEKYQQYVNPNIHMPADAQEINHITDEMLEGQPYIFEIIPNILDFFGTNIVVAHNATFDFRFLAMSCLRYRFKVPRKWFDTMDLKNVWPDVKNRKLSTFLEKAGIENQNAHSALGDAEALALLVIESLNK